MNQRSLPSDILLDLDKRPNQLLVNEKAAAAILGLSVSKLQKDRVKGGGPRFIKYAGAKNSPVRYRLGELREFIQGRMRESTSTYLQVGADLSELGLVRPYGVFGTTLREFLASLSDEPDEIIWLTNEEAAERLRANARGGPADREA